MPLPFLRHVEVRAEQSSRAAGVLVSRWPGVGETMTALDRTTPTEPARGDSQVKSELTDTSSAALTTLRGAGVDVDVRVAGRVVIGLCVVGLGVLVAALFVAGAHKNAQITNLRRHGVPVNVTVSRCLGLLGGSGSNAAGYACTGTFTLEGHRYSEAIPGDSIRAPGSTVRAVAVPGSPPLLSTAHEVAIEHASFGVFVVPTILLVVLVLLMGVLILRRRRKRAPSPDTTSPHDGSDGSSLAGNVVR